MNNDMHLSRLVAYLNFLLGRKKTKAAVTAVNGHRIVDDLFIWVGDTKRVSSHWAQKKNFQVKTPNNNNNYNNNNNNSNNYGQ